MKKIMFDDNYGLNSAVRIGDKTQTRRIVNVPKTYEGVTVRGFYKHTNSQGLWYTSLYDEDGRDIDGSSLLPNYEKGEIVAVAERYKDVLQPDTIVGTNKDGTPLTAIQSKGWSNKMFVKAKFMPHRIRITNIRLQRIQDISDEDCIAEGLQQEYMNMGFGNCLTELRYGFRWETKDLGRSMAFFSKSPREAYSILIDKICGVGTWDSNPWVFAYTFELI